MTRSNSAGLVEVVWSMVGTMALEYDSLGEVEPSEHAMSAPVRHGERANARMRRAFMVRLTERSPAGVS